MLSYEQAFPPLVSSITNQPCLVPQIPQAWPLIKPTNDTTIGSYRYNLTTTDHEILALVRKWLATAKSLEISLSRLIRTMKVTRVYMDDVVGLVKDIVDKKEGRAYRRLRSYLQHFPDYDKQYLEMIEEESKTCDPEGPRYGRCVKMTL